MHNGTVVTLVVNADGSYTFTAFAPLVSPTVGTTEENLPVVIGFTVTDGDGDTATGQLTVNVNDDTPVASTVTAAPTLDDEAQTLFVANPGNPPGGSGDVSPDVKTTSGGIGSLFSAGADGLKSIGFTDPTTLKAIYQGATGLAAQESSTYGDDDGSRWSYDPDRDRCDVGPYGVHAGCCGGRFVHVHGVGAAGASDQQRGDRGEPSGRDRGALR